MKNSILFVSALSAATLLFGCAGSGKAIKPGTKIVDIRVVRILSSGETPGDRNNLGCRLFDEEIEDIMNYSISFESVFGSQTKLTWDGTIIDLVLVDQFTDRDDGTAQSAQVLLQALDQQGGQYLPDPDYLNIYFVGCYTINGTNAWAGTIDPNAAVTVAPGLIFCNDQGLPTSFGSSSQTKYLNAPILLHEMTHYFGRFSQRTFGAGATVRTYDMTEHVPDGTIGNILRSDIEVGNYADDAFIPGVEYSNGTIPACDSELGEISRRICEGLWNSTSVVRCP